MAGVFAIIEGIIDLRVSQWKIIILSKDGIVANCGPIDRSQTKTGTKEPYVETNSKSNN